MCMFLSEQKSRREAPLSAPTMSLAGSGLPWVGRQGLRLPYWPLTALPFSWQWPWEWNSQSYGPALSRCYSCSRQARPATPWSSGKFLKEDGISPSFQSQHYWNGRRKDERTGEGKARPLPVCHGASSPPPWHWLWALCLLSLATSVGSAFPRDPGRCLVTWQMDPFPLWSHKCWVNYNQK